MCGIAGIFHCGTPKPVDPARIERMCEVMAHRGPDGAGVWTGAGVGLGHRRLSIIDIAGSPQPMHSADGNAVLTFNGEIYNYRELRRELEQGGARFRTDGDSEVILAAYQKWGVECLSRLNGMFAFAIYDIQRRQLLLARDRLGVKPLFLTHLSDGSVAFASELKGLLAHPLLKRRIDPLAVEDYMTWGYVPDHRSILRNVRKLAAGHFQLLRHDEAPQPSRQWWDVDFSRRNNGRAADNSVELLHHLREGVSSRMAADVPLGAFLSGGVDSSSVVALMSETSRTPVTTCSIGFDVAALDETSHAEEVAQRYGTDHHSRTIAPGDFQHVDAIGAMFDEPFADASALPTWSVCKLARQHVTVALSGDGADEAFAGYRRHLFHAREEQFRSIMPSAIRGPLFGGLGRIWPKADWAPRYLRAKSTFQSLARDGDTGYAHALSVIPTALRQSLYTERFRRELQGYEGERPLIELMRHAPARTGLDRAQYADLKFWLPGDILTKIDRTSMSVGLEAREPLLDHRLIEFAVQLPIRQRIRGGHGKWLLKHTMERYLPDHILYRPKQGFVTPISQWFRGPLAKEARGIAANPGLADMDWFDGDALRKMAEAHISGRSDHGRILWQLLMLQKSVQRLAPTA